MNCFLYSLLYAALGREKEIDEACKAAACVVTFPPLAPFCIYRFVWKKAQSCSMLKPGVPACFSLLIARSHVGKSMLLLQARHVGFDSYKCRADAVDSTLTVISWRLGRRASLGLVAHGTHRFPRRQVCMKKQVQTRR